ncbi:hypothetical protein SteCoe_9116 [Stentor coeruleus]|uniref:Uncharacterized protein n=1 Tax=Stentor coeruleus TaxID=5963 RepID=A0A1R2CIG2_9CILI|nr:hypothetical protein SteCoe_9116 [Stentor coeruleus]
MRKFREIDDKGIGNFGKLVITTAENYIKSERWEDAIQLIKHTETIDGSHESAPIISQLVSKIAREAISSKDINKALKILLELKLLIEECNFVMPDDRCTVFNNLACAYRRTGKINQAKKYIDKALALSNSSRVSDTEKAAALLNNCSILSELGKHLKASESAFKIIDLISKIPYPSEHLKKLLGLACFNYATEKKELKDLQEAVDYYKKAAITLEGLLGLENVIDESLKQCDNLEEILKSQMKPKSRPVSASLKSRALINRPNDPRYQSAIRSQQISYAPIQDRRASHSYKMPPYPNFITNDYMKYRKEIERIVGRPPVLDRKSKKIERNVPHKPRLKDFKISSQEDIRIIPSRSETVKNSQFSNYNFSSTMLEIANQQTISLPSLSVDKKHEELKIDNFVENPHPPLETVLITENIPISKDSSSIEILPIIETLPIKNPVEDNSDKQASYHLTQEEAAIRIQSAFKGKRIRKKLTIKKSYVMIFRACRKIKDNYFLVTVAKKNQNTLVLLFDLENLSKCFKVKIDVGDQINVDKILGGIDLNDERIPFFIEGEKRIQFKDIFSKDKRGTIKNSS